MSKKPTDMKTYDEINDKLSQQQKESLMTSDIEELRARATAIDVDTTGIYRSVDQVESMIAGDGSDSGIHGRLDTVNYNLGQVISAIDDAKTAIVNAINSLK